MGKQKYHHFVLNWPFSQMSIVRQISQTLPIQLVLSANQCQVPSKKAVLVKVLIELVRVRISHLYNLDDFIPDTLDTWLLEKSST